jgi:hypothetical protein
MGSHRLLIATSVAALALAGFVYAQPVNPPAAPPAAAPAAEQPIAPPAEEPPPAPGETTSDIIPPVEPVPAIVAPPEDDAKADAPEETQKAEAPTPEVKAAEIPVAPEKRLRHGAAVIQALDKITAETMRFEARVGRPVRYKGLVFTVKSCETAAPDEAMDDSVAYMEVRAEPKAASTKRPSRQVFRGWMFASAPGVSAIEHPIYDAWLIACKA